MRMTEAGRTATKHPPRKPPGHSAEPAGLCQDCASAPFLPEPLFASPCLMRESPRGMRSLHYRESPVNPVVSWHKPVLFWNMQTEGCHPLADTSAWREAGVYQRGPLHDKVWESIVLEALEPSILQSPVPLYSFLLNSFLI